MGPSLRRTIPQPLLLAYAVLSASLLAPACRDGLAAQPTTTPKKADTIQVETAHYRVWAAKSRPVADYVARIAESARRDFLDTFKAHIKLKTKSSRFHIRCLDRVVTGTDHRGRPFRLPGAYDTRSGIASIAIVRGYEQLNQNEARVRHEVTHQLMDQLFGIPSVRHDHRFWYHEGLASYFEGTGQFRLNGTVRITRLGTLETSYAAHPIPDLMSVIKMNREDAPELGSLQAYALAWSVCHFLIHGNRGAYRDKFFAYLQNLQDWNNRERNVQLFAQIFPDTAKLQADWIKHIFLLQRGTPEQLARDLKPVGTQPHKLPSKDERRLLPPSPRIAQHVAATPVTPQQRAAIRKILDGDRNLFAAERTAAITRKLAALDFAIPALLSLATEKNPAIQASAITALGDLRARPVMDGLVERALRDPSRDVRLAAARAIQKMNYGIAPQALYTQVLNTVPGKVLPALDALREIRDPYATDFLIAALRRLTRGGGISLSVSSSRQGRRSGKPPKSSPFGPQPVFGSAGRAGSSHASRKQTVIAAILQVLGEIAPEDQGADPKAWFKWDKKRKADANRHR